eukprot:6310836-Ditylum_brightwellii.AAC.1
MFRTVKEKEQFAPQFIGFRQIAKWPLEETYSKWVLAIYKPWRVSIEALKLEDSFSKQLRQNAEHDEAIEVNLNQVVVDLDDDVDGDLPELYFEFLYDGGNDIDWSEGYDT